MQPGACDLQALAASEAEFLRLSRLRQSPENAEISEALRQASTIYIARANACYEVLYGSEKQVIDDDGVWFSPDGSQPFNTVGTKWGAGSPFTGGSAVPGPGLAGGTVRYSFMATGIDMSAEGSDNSLALSGLPTYAPCFITEIDNALAAWSAVANIRFLPIADNGAPFDAAGAVGDIRIAAHTFDGPSSILAHGYYPPPNGESAAGDVHFDWQENWSCTAGTGVIDIGIVAVHELGHAIGLNHEINNPAIMQPYYNPGLTVPIADDINGAQSIYGPPVGPPGDYDGDRKTDVVVHRPSTGVWFGLRSTANYMTSFALAWGTSGDVPLDGDFDHDGKADLAIYRPGTGTWYLRRSSSNNTTYDTALWGLATDIPVSQDFDGNGIADVAVFRPSTGGWHFRQPNAIVQWGQSGDIPVPADYNADGRADIAVFRPSSGMWYVRNVLTYTWGLSTDVPVPGDYDGDGKSELAIFRPGNGGWYIRWSATNYGTWSFLPWGVNGDIPVPGDYDGDGRTDPAVFRPSNGARYIWYSSGGTTALNWGTSGDIPMPRLP